MARSAGGVAVSLAGLLLLCFSAAPCDGGSRMVLNEETGAIEIISSPGVQQVGGTPRGKKTEKARNRKDLISAPCGLGHLSGFGSRDYGSADPSLCQTAPTGQRDSPKGGPWISPRVLAGRPKQWGKRKRPRVACCRVGHALPSRERRDQMTRALHAR